VETRSNIQDAIVVADEDLAEVQTTLEQLQLAGASREAGTSSEAAGQEEQVDQKAMKQIEAERTSLLATRNILEELLPKIEEKAINRVANQPHQYNVQVAFGANNKGSQIAVNNAPINMAFGRKE
jgi:hypothetical protein